MRKLGYILLIFGFVWICWSAFFVSAVPRSIVTIYDERYPDTQSYSGKQLRQAYRDVLMDYRGVRDHLPFVALPAALMLVGGILLDHAARRDAKRNPPIIHDDRPVA
jgi:hypothetical protein